MVEANVEDMPFLIDSVTEELRRHGLAVRNVMHPVIGVERDGNGRLAAVVPARGALHRESVMHFEVDRRMPEAELEQLTSDVIRVIGDVALSVRDFHAMADRVGQDDRVRPGRRPPATRGTRSPRPWPSWSG